MRVDDPHNGVDHSSQRRIDRRGQLVSEVERRHPATDDERSGRLAVQVVSEGDERGWALMVLTTSDRRCRLVPPGRGSTEPGDRSRLASMNTTRLTALMSNDSSGVS